MDGKKSKEKEVVEERLYLSCENHGGPSGRRSRRNPIIPAVGAEGHQNTYEDDSNKMAARELL